MKQATTATGRKWQRYNRWRSKFRELDRKRRLERLAQRKADCVSGYTVKRVPVPRIKAWATVTIRFGDGQKARFSIHETPFGHSISNTLAGRKVSAVLANYQPQ